MKTNYLVLLGVLALALCGCPGSNAVCDRADSVDLTAKAGMCSGADRGKPLGGKSACNNSIGKCSSADQATLKSMVDCLGNLTNCTPATEGGYLQLQQACYASLPSLSKACQDAVFTMGLPGDAGEDGGVDAGRQPADGGGAIDLIGVADESGFALAWSSRQTAPFDQWELDSFDTDGMRLPNELLTPPSLRTWDLDDAGTLTKRSFFLAAITADGKLVSGQPPDAGMMTSDAGQTCQTGLDCPVDQVCDLSQCKTQSCQPGGAVTCPPGYVCQPTKVCERMFSDAGTLDAGMQMTGNFVPLPLLSDLVTVSTGSPGFSSGVYLGGYAGLRPAVVGIDSARQFVALEQAAQPFGHVSRLRGKDLESDSDSTSPIDTLGQNIHLAYVPESDTLFACYDVGRGVRVRRSRDLGRTWGASAVDVLPVDDGGLTSQIHDCALAPWKNGSALMATIDDDQVAVRTVSEALSVGNPDIAFASSPPDAGNIYAPNHPTIATLPSDSIVHVGFTGMRTANMVVDTEIYDSYRDGTLGAYTQPKLINNTGITTGNAFPQDYVSITVDPVTKKAVAAYTSVEDQGLGPYSTVYLSLWNPSTKTWGTGSDLSVFAQQQTQYLVLPTRANTDEWDAFSPALAATRTGKIFLSFLAGKRVGGNDDLRMYLVRFDWNTPSPLAMVNGWFVVPALPMSSTRVYAPAAGGVSSVPPSFTALSADQQLSVYGVFVEGAGANGDIPARAIMVSRP